MNTLTPAQRSFLRSRAHALKPVVVTGQAGLTDAVLDEIERCLAHHELIKIKLNFEDRRIRRQQAEIICRKTGSHGVQHIGRMAVLYRPAVKPRIQLPV